MDTCFIFFSSLGSTCFDLCTFLPQIQHIISTYHNSPFSMWKYRGAHYFLYSFELGIEPRAMSNQHSTNIKANFRGNHKQKKMSLCAVGAGTFCIWPSRVHSTHPEYPQRIFRRFSGLNLDQIGLLHINDAASQISLRSLSFFLRALQNLITPSETNFISLMGCTWEISLKFLYLFLHILHFFHKGLIWHNIKPWVKKLFLQKPHIQKSVFQFIVQLMFHFESKHKTLKDDWFSFSAFLK